MSYSGRFVIDDAGVSLTVELPNEAGSRRCMLVCFTFEHMQRTPDVRQLVHGIIARRVVDATRSLDEED